MPARRLAPLARRTCAAAILLAALLAAPPGCATSSSTAAAGPSGADWECPAFPEGVTEFKVVEPPLTLSVAEARQRLAELERYVWFDTPAGIERPEFATWGAKTKVEEVRCLRRAGDGFKSVFARDGHLYSVPAESFASIGGSALRFETPVLIRTSKRVYISYATATPDYSRQHSHPGGGPPGGPGHYAVTRGRDSLSINMGRVLPDDPDGYRYLVDKDEDRWVEDTGYATFVALPTRGRELDPSRPGYALTVIKEEPYLEVRTIQIAG
ncbi:MAG: hypothetical protein R3B09_27220 [Nannocystaceae bacterium]